MPDSPLDGAGTGFLIADVYRLMRRSMNRRAQHVDLTPEQWRALLHLSRCEGITQVMLAEQLEIQPISLARTLDKLQHNLVIERRTSPSDRRAFELFLTPAAKPVLKQLHALGQKTRNEPLSGLRQRDLSTLARLLETIKQNLIEAEEPLAEPPNARGNNP